MSFHKEQTGDDIHVLPARTYADITARDADTDFNTDPLNIDKLVRVESPSGYFALFSVGPAVWISTQILIDTFLDLTDTPSSYVGQIRRPVIVNAGETAVEFGPVSPNIVDVFVASDIPNNLVANTKYLIKAPITFGNGEEKTFPAGVAEITSDNTVINTITYTGTGTFLNGTGVFVAAMNCIFISTSGSATFIDMTGSGAGSVFSWLGGAARGWDDMGTFTDFATVGQSFVAIADFGSGFNFVNCLNYFSTATAMLNTSDTGTDYLAFDSSIENINIVGDSFRPQGNERIFNIDSGANVIALFTAIQLVSAEGLYFRAGSLDQTVPGIIAANCRNLPDSTITGEYNLIGNTASTSIPAVGAHVEIALNVDWVGDNIERLSEPLIAQPTASVTSLALRSTNIKMDGNVNLEPTTATKEVSVTLGLVSPPDIVVTFTNGSNLVNEPGTALFNGDILSFRETAGTLPAELRTDIVYFIVNQLTNSFQVSYTSGGAAIAFTDDGSGTNSYQIAELHGSVPTSTIQAGSPQELIPQALVPSILNSKSFLLVINKTDAVNINVNGAYQRYAQ